MAVSQAHRILHWQENLLGDEMPPEWIWPFDDLLEEWFDEVERKRKDRYDSSGNGDDEDEESEMMGNELAARRRARK